MLARTISIIIIAAALVANARAEDEGLPSPIMPLSHAPPLAHEPPVVILGDYVEDKLPELLAAVNSSGLPASVPVYIGHYGVSREQSKLIHEKLPANGHYAPLFTLVRNESLWNARLPLHERGKRGTQSNEERGEKRDGFEQALTGLGGASSNDGALTASLLWRPTEEALEGAIPPNDELAKLGDADRFTWALEVGRRFRDLIRVERERGHRIETWQLDEISPSSADPEKGPNVRLFTRGVLEGLCYGRKHEGDRKLEGIVYISNSAFKLGDQALTPELEKFWAAVDDTCFRLVGEEYPTFTDRTSIAASVEKQARLQRALARQPGAGARLSRKYVSGNSPGYRVGVFLGGIVPSLHWHRDEVNAWRRSWLEVRARLGIAGIGEFCWVKENDRPRVFEDTMKGVASGIEMIR